MTTPEWIDLCGLEELAEAEPTLKKAGKQRFACVRRGDGVDVLDDRCPHQGYPLSQGTVRDGVLTCAWHNWKFETGTGTCTFGGDAVRRYPARVEGGRVKLDVAVDTGAEIERASRGVREGLFEGDVGRVVREGLRLGAVAMGPPELGPSELGPVGAAFVVAAVDAADRAPWGFGHDLSAMADLATFVAEGLLPPIEGLSVEATLIGELLQARPKRAAVEAAPHGDLSVLLAEERREQAEAGARHLAREREGGGGVGAAVDAMASFLASDLLDYGHGAIHAAKAIELGARFPAAGEAIAGSLAVLLGWATAETKLPPFAVTRRALDQVPDAVARGAALEGSTRRDLEAAILVGEKSAVGAVVESLRGGVAPRDLLLAAAHAAATRVTRFDRAWEARTDAEVGLLDVTHAVTYAEAALALAARPAFTALAPRFAILAAGFVGKLKRADGPAIEPRGGVELTDAIAARDLPAARGAAKGLDHAARARAFREAVPFAAHDAFVRPIFIAHAIKMLEALRRLDAIDVAVDDSTYLDAFLATVVPRGSERSGRRVAHVASRFLEDGRPPEGLY